MLFQFSKLVARLLDFGWIKYFSVISEPVADDLLVQSFVICAASVGKELRQLQHKKTKS